MGIGLSKYSIEFCIAVGLLFYLSTTSSHGEEIKKLNLDDAGTLATTITTDRRVKSEGQGSIRISTSWPTTICLGEMSGIEVDDTVLVCQARVRSQKLEGFAFLEMWCQVGGKQYFSRGLNPTVQGTSDCKSLETRFMLQIGQKAEKATLNIVMNGKGTVWVDEAVLLTQPLQ
ncbi:MAG: hypothetical protein GTO13_05670 [Proteobacteria bacterium]|nr:hypothetical protein [Pseudomonadota bacterium]